jgi:hypothetical protein
MCEIFQILIILKKVKVKISRNRIESLQEGRRIDLHSLDLGARRGERSAPRPGRFTPGKDPVPIVHEAGVGPRAGLVVCEKSRPYQGFDPRTVQPVASRYTD